MRKRFVIYCVMLFCFVGYSNLILAQQRTISGKVLSEKDNQPLQNISITFPGTQRGGKTNENGDFSLKVPPSVKSFLVSGIGYKDKTIEIKDKSSFIVNLEEKVDSSEDIVVTTAGGIRTKRKEIGTAMTSISAEVLTRGKATNIASGLQGKVPGLLISGVSGGVNPSYRVVLRGNRSLTGNNQALLVLDNVIVTNDVLGNLNPNDIEDITVLNGAGAAALYGSAASNGALIVTTKRGKKGHPQITLQNTTMAEQVAFLPKLQKEFGSGGTGYGTDENGQPGYSYIENQSYGPKFNGKKVPVGAVLQDGSQDSTTYDYKDGHDKFWVTGITNQTDFSLSSGDDNSTTYIAGQYVHTTGTTPDDVYKRYSVRINGSRKLLSNLSLDYNTNYVVNKYDITTQTGTMYDQMLNMPGDIDVTKYKNWRTDKFAMEDNFYNPWYRNPYFTKDNWRNLATNTYLLASVQLKYSPIQGLDIIGREGLTYRNNTSKSTVGAFQYSDYRKATESFGKADVVASVSDYNNTIKQLITDLFAQYRHSFSRDFTLNAIAGAQWTQRESKYVSVAGSGMPVPVYNVSQATSTSLGEADYSSRQVGVYGDIRFGYKGYLFLHGTGRNDWVSILNPPNNKFFYPSVDISYVASDAIPAIKQSNLISFLKFRAGWSKTGQVNLGNSTNNGAYLLATTASQANGFPFNGTAGYTINGQLVVDGLKPEITKGYEIGFDLNLLSDRITTTLTWYDNKSDNQTVTPSISGATGYSSVIMNGGTVKNKGIEAMLHVTPIKNDKWNLTVGGNYTYSYNKVASITPLLPNINLSNSNGGNGDSYALAGQDFSVIMGYDYNRDDQGRVIVDPNTGAPTQTSTFKNLGSTLNKNRLTLDFSLAYKRLSLSALFEYRGGGKIYNGIGTSLDWSGMGYRTAIYDRQPFVFPNSSYLDPTTNTYVKNTNIVLRDANGNSGFWGETINRGVAANYVTSADFWKLREVSLAYDVDPKLWGNNTTVIKGITVSAQARNLFMWLAKDNYYTDPEYSSPGADSNGIGVNGISNTPPSRFYGATISVRF